MIFEAPASHATTGINTSLPGSVSLLNLLPTVFNQGSIGSCTANASGAMYYAILKKTQMQLVFIPSRLFIYYNSRMIEGSTSRDRGATLRDTMKSLYNYGVCRELIWPYQAGNLFLRPTLTCYTEGKNREILNYASVGINVDQLRAVLAAGYPIIIGFLVYSSFETISVAQSGNVPIPNPATEALLGGHAVCLFGYNDTIQCFMARNSWGSSWGLNGNFNMPYAYAANPNLCFEAWTLYSIKNFSITTNNIRIHVP